MQEIQQNDPTAAEFISNQETRPEVNSKLSSLLITPIQRVPRYKLLLKEVLRHTPPRQKEYNELQGLTFNYKIGLLLVLQMSDLVLYRSNVIKKRDIHSFFVLM